MYVIITCKYEKDPIKNNREKVAKQFFKLKHYLLPWKPEIGSGRISISSKLLGMSSLPASINIAKSEQSSHTPGGSHQGPYHFNLKEGKMDK